MEKGRNEEKKLKNRRYREKKDVIEKEGMMKRRNQKWKINY